MPQADRLERRQLVETCPRDRPARDVPAPSLPGEEAEIEVDDEPVQPVDGEAVHGPDREVAEREDPRGD